MTGRTVENRVHDWLVAFRAVQAELTPDELRALTALAQANPTDAIAIQTGLQAARIVFANDRSAAIVAAMLTQSGVSRPVVTEDEA